MEKTLAVLFAAVMAVVIAGCGEGATSPTEAPLQGTWQLSVLQSTGGTRQTITEPQRFTAEFLAGGELHVRADCNRCNGTYALTGRALRVGPLACTRAACELATIESAYTRILQDASTAESLTDTLQITGPSGVVILRR
jgi:heat shock protein HslJ